MDVVRVLQRLGPRRSILRYLVVWTAVLLGGFSLIDLAVEYPREAQALDAARDRVIARIAAGTLRALRTQDHDTSRIPAAVFREEIGRDDSTTPLRFRVSDEHGGLVGGDDHLVPPAARRGEAVLQPLWEQQTLEGQDWRVVAVRDDLLPRVQGGGATVQVAEPVSARRAAHRELLRAMAGAIGLRLAVVLAVVWAVLWLALQPLAALRSELQRRRPVDLEPLPLQRPAEIAPLVQAVNGLLQEQQHSLDQQRRFLADASHQLRTPIAVLRTQLHGLLGGQTAAAETLPQMMATIDRATRLTNQLLSQAKVEQLARRADWVEVDLEQVAREVALEFAPLIGRRRLDFTLEAAPLKLRTDPWLLAELVRNLMSNAVHHSPKGAELGIVVRQLCDEPELIVWDHGGGVTEDVRTRLFEPFHAARGGTGIGLGLSICRQIAESMQASVGLFNRIEGGQVIGVDAVVRWPAVAAQEDSHG